MKKLIAFVLVALVGCTEKENLTFYGETFEAEEAIDTREFVSKMESMDSASFTVKAKIIETCEMKGCWMTLDLGTDEEMRVTFKDYGFFVPTDGVEGKEVVITGMAKKVTTDVEMLKHYAQDAGKSAEEIAAITEPVEEVTFIATGAAIKDVPVIKESDQE